MEVNHDKNVVVIDTAIFTELMTMLLRSRDGHTEFADIANRHAHKFNPHFPNLNTEVIQRGLAACRKDAARVRQLCRTHRNKTVYWMIDKGQGREFLRYVPILFKGRSKHSQNIVGWSAYHSSNGILHLPVDKIFTREELPTDFVEFTQEGIWKGAFVYPQIS